MSLVEGQAPARLSVHATMTPPWPSGTMTGSLCTHIAVTTATPFVVQRGVPAASTCCTKMSWSKLSTLRPSTQAMNAPPAPSEVA